MEEHIVLINYTNGDGYQGKEYCEIREEIVRCRDCMFYDQNPILSGCTQFDFGMPKDMSNGFCAWGKRQ